MRSLKLSLTIAVAANLVSVPSFAKWVKTEREAHFKEPPKYFFRGFRDSALVTFNVGYQEGGNRLRHVDSGKEWKLPGGVDPVPSPDNGRILTVPDLYGYNFGPLVPGMRLYDTASFIRGEKKPVLIHTDHALPGSYQTMGVLDTVQEGDSEVVHYRIVAESVTDKDWGFYIQEYWVRHFPYNHKNYQPAKFIKQRWDKPKKVCETLTWDTRSSGAPVPERMAHNASFTLPMLSKTGLLLGAAHPVTKETLIIDIRDPENCVVKHNLGMSTGKLDFNYDDSKVAFHVNMADGTRTITRITSTHEVLGYPDELIKDPTNLTNMRTPNPTYALEAMTYKLDTSIPWDQRFEHVTHCSTRKTSCYYPAFRANGEIMVMEQRKSKKRSDFDYVLTYLKDDGEEPEWEMKQLFPKSW